MALLPVLRRSDSHLIKILNIFSELNSNTIEDVKARSEIFAQKSLDSYNEIETYFDSINFQPDEDLDMKDIAREMQSVGSDQSKEYPSHAKDIEFLDEDNEEEKLISINIEQKHILAIPKRKRMIKNMM